MFKKLSVYILLYLLTAWIILSVFFLTPIQKDNYPLLRFIIIAFATVLLTKYFVYMFISPWHDVKVAFKEYKERKLKSAFKYEPLVSVLVPAWNEEDGIITTAQALLQSTYKNMEIIVIDNASTDNTASNVKSLIRKYENSLELDGETHIKIIYLREDRQGKGHALNKGIKMSRGDILMSIDADCYVPPKTVESFVGHFKDPKISAAVGNVKIGNTDTLLGVIQYLEFLFSFYFKKSDSLLGAIYIIGGAAGAFRREVFEKLGGYNTTNITEDIDLSVRIQHSGMKIAYAPDAVVFTEGASTLSGLMKQRLRWKRGRFETFFEYRHMFFSTKRKHNKILTWFILPLAVFGDMQLAFELFFLAFLYIYSYLVHDYSSFISGIIVVSSMFAIQIIFDGYRKKMGRLILLAPIGWLLLYVSTFVEFNALVKSFIGYMRKEEVKWQNWKRSGVFLKQPEEKKKVVEIVKPL
jgi:poly-beta-1,6-N-acetyl-D-glucosamine synthase